MAVGCALAVLVEVASFTNLFGLVHPSAGSGAPAPPDLNPHRQVIFAIVSSVTYLGPLHGYFPMLEGTSLCGAACPELPREWASDGILPAEIGVFFFYNITNTGAHNVNLSVPIVSTTGSNPTLFFLQTFCCYSAAVPPYTELLDSPIQSNPGLQFGLEGYAYTTVPLPALASGGYTLYVNFTSD